ncbi:hypothetical protein J27TS7_39550 [Paenibacillus dendritiformis]|uniref:hypothetical protein n=2 Tax=Paenibacillus dendritiformis TaxID=130049 RepID=UPI001B2DC3FB|nr:hypothetical protein J27TS7_39550 [Paenibacillus dendritiformis]
MKDLKESNGGIEMKLGAKLGIVLGIIAVLLIPAYFIGRTFGLFQGEVVLTRYALAIEADGRKYDVWPLIASFAAMDKRGDDRQLYYRAERSDINYLFQLAYKEFEPEPSDDNPYLAGKIHYGGERDKYVTEVRQYENARDSKQVYTSMTARAVLSIPTIRKPPSIASI